MYIFFLVLHITFGIISIVFCLLALVKITFKKKINYLDWMKTIAALSVLSISSGIGLFFVQAIEMTIFQVCMKLGSYLFVILFTEVLLYFKYRIFENLAQAW